MLVIMRHGQSTWTQSSVNKFAGWVDVPLTEQGREQARHAGELLAQYHIKPDVVFTSLLSRSITTANIALDTCDRLWIPVHRTWRLNERHYGAFQGQTRPEMLAQVGAERLQAIRRGTHTRPPELALDAPYAQCHDPRYSAQFADQLDMINPALVRAECLDDVWQRLQPYWNAEILPKLAAGQTVLIVTHGSVVRQIVRVLNHLDDDAIQQLNVPTGVPMKFELTVEHNAAAGTNTIVSSDEGTYLDEQAARAGIEAVHALV